MIPLCDLCSTRHQPYQAHVFATNTMRLTEDVLPKLDAVGVRGDQPVDDTRLPIKTRNRRSREAYNEYQREYMRKRRASKN